jgi:hypothetical protein
MPQLRLSASIEELQELFGIDLIPHEPFAFSAMQHRSRWTIETTESLEAFYVGGLSITLIALILRHSKETVSQFVWSLRLYERR